MPTSADTCSSLGDEGQQVVSARLDLHVEVLPGSTLRDNCWHLAQGYPKSLGADENSLLSCQPNLVSHLLLSGAASTWSFVVT